MGESEGEHIQRHRHQRPEESRTAEAEEEVVVVRLRAAGAAELPWVGEVGGMQKHPGREVPVILAGRLVERRSIVGSIAYICVMC